MLANVVRRQARVALTVAARQSTPSVLARIARPNSLVLRPFSTTFSRCNDTAAADAGQKPKVQYPPSRQLFVANLHFDTVEADIHAQASQFGDVEDVRLLKYSDGSNRGAGFVVFTNQAAADECLSKGLQVSGRPLRVAYSSPPSNQQAPNPEVFVGSIPFNTNETRLREILEPFGAIDGIRIAREKEGEPRGFAHVTFANTEGAIKAVEGVKKTPVRLLDRQIRLAFAAPRTIEPKTP
ncbi:hypothetical protein R3P38DRAFT_2436386, partial [Favolaschia claudopus]